MVGFLFPNNVEPPSFLVRAVIAITLFEAAYIAEIVRGGLQAVPRGQIEAAQAIGLSPVKVMRRVVLPQALRAVIPAMVGQFISLFKDTSLLAIVGFFEMLRVVDAVTQQDAFRGEGLRPIALAFVGLIYWAGCSTMSRESQRLERRLGVGER
jgi:general L-amino acid transport system permease protein